MPIIGSAVVAGGTALASWLGPVGVATAVAGVAGAGASIYAANTQSRASANALKLAQDQLGPYAAEGNTLRPTINGLLGVGADGQPDPNIAQKILAASPDYQFAQQQGQLAVDRHNAATGQFLGGAAVKDTAEFNQGLATQTLGNYYNRLMQMYMSGQGSASNFANLGSSLVNQQGQSQASGAVGAANAVGTLPQNLLYSQMANQMNNKTTGDPTGYTNVPGTSPVPTGGANGWASI